MELENQGGPGTAMDHWEKRLLGVSWFVCEWTLMQIDLVVVYFTPFVCECTLIKNRLYLTLIMCQCTLIYTDRLCCYLPYTVFTFRMRR